MPPTRRYPMRVAIVESTTLATVGYDENLKRLQLEFCSRAVYLYFGVPAAVYEGLLDAPSKGRYFNGTIRGRYPYRLILGSNPALQSAEAAVGCDR
jgi:hypothetical protein